MVKAQNNMIIEPLCSNDQYLMKIFLKTDFLESNMDTIFYKKREISILRATFNKKIHNIYRNSTVQNVNTKPVSTSILIVFDPLSLSSK